MNSLYQTYTGWFFPSRFLTQNSCLWTIAWVCGNSNALLKIQADKISRVLYPLNYIKLRPNLYPYLRPNLRLRLLGILNFLDYVTLLGYAFLLTVRRRNWWKGVATKTDIFFKKWSPISFYFYKRLCWCKHLDNRFKPIFRLNDHSLLVIWFFVGMIFSMLYWNVNLGNWYHSVLKSLKMRFKFKNGTP